MVKASSAFSASSMVMLHDDAVVRVHGGLPQLFGVHLTKALVAVDLCARHLLREHGHFGVVVGVLDGVALLHLEQGRLGNVDMALLDEGAHIAEEEGQHQGADVGAVHIGIGHDEDFVVPQLGDIKFLADAAAQRQHHRHQLVVAVDAVGAGLFHVQHLAPQGKDGLDGGVAAHLGRAACRVALDDEDLGAGGVFLAAVGQLAGHPAGLQRALAAHQLAGLFGSGAGAGGLGGLFKNGLGHAGVLLKELHQLGVDHVGDEGADLGIAQLRLGLALELGLLQLDRDDADEALADVCAGQVLVLLLQQAVAAAVIVEHAGQAGCGSPLRGCRRPGC